VKGPAKAAKNTAKKTAAKGPKKATAVKPPVLAEGATE
jgi:hypothetical protein